MKNIFFILFFSGFLCACAHSGGAAGNENFRFRHYGSAYRDLAARSLLETLGEAGFALEKPESEDLFAKGVSLDGKTEIVVFMTERPKEVLFELSFYYKGGAVRKAKPYDDLFADMEERIFSYGR